MTTAVGYIASARRHLNDAYILLQSEAKAHSGQLFGFCVECGIKAVLLASGVPTDSDGGIPGKHKFRRHMPTLSNHISAFGELIPDGVLARRYFAQLPGRDKLSSWNVEHRYYRETAIPLADLPEWEHAAGEVIQMLDQVEADGIFL
ncbi:hypothetical protein RP726_01615 [Candidatus Methylospira mobilis]|uniref:hypothetical protein n=1 Tax=Candidatus Methylospira mobilis TaxID=1808979 RepID=UPI0028EAADCE|nr:hypothetical protein [Candidatus Methylospira mobilis]WNV05120.1 hypothetical protein RP726_01615 [Candidatus Methylospira mobilis]